MLPSFFVCLEMKVHAMAADTDTKTTETTPAKPTAKAAKTAAVEKPAKLRIKMHTSTAGFEQVPDLNEDGSPKFNPKTGKQLMKNGREFSWLPGQEYDVATDCAERYIELGYASLVE